MTLRCGRLIVPLSRDGRARGALGLPVAAAPSEPSRPGLLVALGGGPGQGSVAGTESFELVLAPLLRRHRLAVFDQRGTGSGALICPALQRAGGLDPVTAADAGACAQRLGPARAFFTTQDSVADIEALRKRFGVQRIALYGISYGTYVAVQYARRYPDHVESLVLDSVVGPSGVDAFALESFAALPRVLREQCRAKACRGVTSNPVGDVATLRTRLAARPLIAPRYDAQGRRRGGRLRAPEELFNLLVAGDLNPYLQAALPAAIRSAVAGDAAPLVRLREIASGPPSRAADISFALNLATTCSDVRLPYSLTSPFADRAAASRGALASVPADRFAPFDRATVASASLAELCRRYPPTDVPAVAEQAPPDVPVLLLNGRLDIRTPVESARAVARLFPKAQVVEVPGTGHDQVDSDLTGCVSTALRRFAVGRAVGTPCRNVSNQVATRIGAPRSLAVLQGARGVPGARGRVTSAVLATLSDAGTTSLQTLYAGFAGDPSGGGLRGGRFRAVVSDAGVDLRLDDYAYVPGVRVSGRVRLLGDSAVGRVVVDAPGRSADGQLTLRGTGASGRLGGRAVRVRPRAVTAASRTRLAFGPRELAPALDRQRRLGGRPTP